MRPLPTTPDRRGRRAAFDPRSTSRQLKTATDSIRS